MTIVEDDEPLLGSYVNFLNFPYGSVLSSEVGDIRVSTDYKYIILSIYRKISSSSKVLVYQSKLFPDKKKICTAWQIGDVITQWMQNYSVNFSTFIFEESVSGTSKNLDIFFCKRLAKYNEIKNKPLISSRVFDIPNDYDLYHFFSYIIDKSKSQSLSIEASGLLASGEQAKVSLQWTIDAADDKIISSSFCINDILHEQEDYYEKSKRLVSVSSVVLTVLNNGSTSDISASYFVSDDPDLISFSFVNCFGLTESITFHAEVVPDIKIEAESAVIGHSVMQYDIEHSQFFKVEVNNILYSQWNSISQFITSNSIATEPDGKEVILSDISSDTCHNYDQLGSLKFNFRYKDDRLIL